MGFCELDLPEAVMEVMAYEAYFRSPCTMCSMGKVNEVESLLIETMKKRTVIDLASIFSECSLQHQELMVLDPPLAGWIVLSRALELLNTTQNVEFVPDTGILYCILHGEMFTEEQNELVESAAEMLYGLIHVRYILTSKGMAAMLDKYKNYDFGRCPRVYCCGQPCLPVGQSDIPRSNIDGAYFGTTFPHLFLMTYGHLKPQKASQSYVPRIFGFKVHKP
ncbi:casein kinase 2 regulatory subunit [Asimina triloba]